MGLALKGSKPAQLVKDTGLWTIVGLVIVIFSGLLIFSSDPIRYIYNTGFQWKMVALVVAILYNYTVHRKVAMSGAASEGMQRFVGVLSVLLWILVPFGGIWISFV